MRLLAEAKAKVPLATKEVDNEAPRVSVHCEKNMPNHREYSHDYASVCIRVASKILEFMHADRAGPQRLRGLLLIPGP